ncbi:MAG: hypothetical protein M1288_02825 [Actinobacteria bacterium]|nr:hypothetical protein [Actinomycetota bacterium]
MSGSQIKGNSGQALHGGPPATTSTLVKNPCAITVDIAKWTNSELAGQMLVTSADIGSLQSADKAVSSGVGGIVLMGNANSQDLKSEISSLVSKSPMGIRPLVMTDEEGGAIQRLAELVGSMPWPRTMASSMTLAAVENMSYSVGLKMKNLGVNVDLAPVVDLDAGAGPSRTNPDGKRSFSPQPLIAAEYAQRFMLGMIKAGVIPVMKHFPGLGQSSGNTDVMAAHTLPYQELVSTGLVPFEKLKTMPAMVMVSNASVPGLSKGVPSSLSPKVMSILRSVVGFGGVVITDSLETVSIQSYQPNISKAVVDSAAAGADLIMLASSNPNQFSVYSEARAALANAILTNQISRPLAEQRVGQILELKGVASSCIYY